VKVREKLLPERQDIKRNRVYREAHLNETSKFPLPFWWKLYNFVAKVKNRIAKMTEFWESCFIEKQTMWGFEPAESAIAAKDFFIREKAGDILIPGIGYGRNAGVFLDAGMNVTGIEISKTAIELARTQNRLNIPIYHGSVADMPFDNKLYDGIFNYALIHLLNKNERNKFIRDCHDQLKPNGSLFFSFISKNDPMYGSGRELSKDWFEMPSGVKLFFYNSDSIEREFGNYGLIDFSEIDEPVKFMQNHPPMKFTIVKCKRKSA
jgi:SAM-dependent methyltransferase